jgi:hypothetical protein
MNYEETMNKFVFVIHCGDLRASQPPKVMHLTIQLGLAPTMVSHPKLSMHEPPPFEPQRKASLLNTYHRASLLRIQSKSVVRTPDQ